MANLLERLGVKESTYLMLTVVATVTDEIERMI